MFTIDPIILTNIILMSFVICLSLFICCVLIYRFFQRKSKVPLYLAFTSICISIPTLFSISLLVQLGMQGFSPETIPPQPLTYINGFPFIFIGLSTIFLYYLIYNVFTEISSKLKIILFLTILIPTCIIMFLIITGSILSSDLAIYGLYASFTMGYLLIVSVISAYEYFYIMAKSFKLFRRVDIPKEAKAGFRGIFIYTLMAVVFMPLMVGHLILNNFGITYGITWLLAGVSAIFAYLGFLHPQSSSKTQ